MSLVILIVVALLFKPIITTILCIPVYIAQLISKFFK